MFKTKLLPIIVAGALLVAGCSDSGTNPDNPDEGDGAKPTATINNPGSSGEPLEGEVTVSVDGSAENGFDAARVYLDGEEIASTDNPSLPYETSIKTQTHNNGDYELVAELDVSDPDTTVSDTVSVTLENYMVTFQTDGYIEDYLKENNDAAYLFIADPDGKVLREVELTSRTDGTMKFLPPSMLEDGAPETFTVTLVNKYTGSNNREVLDLNTSVGFEPWSTIYRSYSSVSSGSSDSKKSMKVYLHDFDQTPLYTTFTTHDYSDYQYYFHYDSSLDTTVKVTADYDDLVINHFPDYRNIDNAVPKYKWENDLTDMPDSVAYDVSSDFNEMVSHNVSVPSGVKVNSYRYYMTVAPNSFDEGDIFFNGFGTSGFGDANGSDPGVGMWVPQISERSFITYFQAVDESNSNINYYMETPVGDFPDEFRALDAETDVTNKSMDDLQFDISGTLDFAEITATNSSDTHAHTWSVTLPDTATSFAFPNIADSLDSSIKYYDRSAFQISYVYMSDLGKVDGYSGYLDWRFGSEDINIIEYYEKYRALNTSSQQKLSQETFPRQPGKFKIHEAHPRQTPVHLKDEF